MSKSDAKNDAPKGDEGPGNFIRDIVLDDLQTGKSYGRLVTRFPPEPNGYLHVGHAKAICTAFGLAQLSENGKCNLRFDDTNPEAESTEFVEGIMRDVKWLGFDWGEKAYFASEYFDQLYAWAVKLVEEGLAYVDTRSEGEIRDTRGDFHKPGVNSPFRDRSVEENLALLEQMKNGELDEGSAVLRAKIDMASTDVKLRDPLLYRIKKVPHHRTGDAWNIYPMYDWAHGQSDAIEGVTHSTCSLEFVNHRPLYNWFLKAIGIEEPPRQIEFGRLNLNYTITSKRKLKQLVEDHHVEGWDDPRMPTIVGMRRRGFTPESIRRFMNKIGVSKNDGVVDVGLLEHCLRDHLNDTSKRVMAVLRPLKVTITNYPEDQEDSFDLRYFPPRRDIEVLDTSTRAVPFSREIWVERDDFMKEAPKKWWRLAPGKEVRLRGAALITVQDVVEENGEVVELRCTWDPESRGGAAPDGRKVRGTIHWVSAKHAVDAKVRLYDRLFDHENPAAAENFLEHLNPASLEVIDNAKVEPSLANASPEERFQFQRTGFFVCDGPSKEAGELVFNRTITLKDAWAKLAKK